MRELCAQSRIQEGTSVDAKRASRGAAALRAGWIQANCRGTAPGLGAEGPRRRNLGTEGWLTRWLDGFCNTQFAPQQRARIQDGVEFRADENDERNQIHPDQQGNRNTQRS